MAVAELFSLLVPPCCATCRATAEVGDPICARCHAALEALPVPPQVPLSGLDASWAAMPHRGAARELVAALKFRRLLAVAEPIAHLIATRSPPRRLDGTLVAVPAAPDRLLRRGFDPAEEITSRLAGATGLPHRALLRRAGARPQVGRTRESRLADPPRVWAADAAPQVALLVDDVQTTGATLRACAEALRGAGAARVSALTFARTL